MADLIISLYKKYGDQNYTIGEDMTQLQHAEQCAYLAEKHGCSDKVIIAALLHDIGHLIGIEKKSEKMGDYGIHNHELVGSNYLRELKLDETICDLIQNHVNVKRYLISINDGYYNKLSDASKKTFEYQGGKMNDKEIKEFKNHPNIDDLLLLRQIDDNGKIKDAIVPGIDIYKNMIELQIKKNIIKH
jgi:putative nucleotidyltransferase with HDIG domain